MKVKELVDALERFAPLPLQDDYDNSGLQVGVTEAEVSGALLCLDVTPQVIDEAVAVGCNMVISHHPLLFRPLKSITGKSMVERTVMQAIRNGITIYAAHTNLDNAPEGVSARMAARLSLKECSPLSPIQGGGAGMTGYLESPLPETEFLALVAERFSLKCIRHNGQYSGTIHKVALCGGSGAFLIPKALECGAQAFITGEIGYHRFFGYDGELKLLEIGHYESEQFTVDLLSDLLRNEFPNLRRVECSVRTNPIEYYHANK